MYKCALTNMVKFILLVSSVLSRETFKGCNKAKRRATGSTRKITKLRPKVGNKSSSNGRHALTIHMNIKAITYTEIYTYIRVCMCI